MKKKTICLITFHRAYNYGAALQAYATMLFLNDLGYETKIIDYTPDYLRGFGTLKNTFNQADNKCKNIFKRTVYTLIKTPSYKKLKKTFNNFIDNNMNLTKKYPSYNDLLKDIPEASYYCSGSDQIWNNYYTEKFDDAFFLNFLKNGEKCFSLASSFGKNKFNKEEQIYIKNSLSKYSFITVREKEGKDLLEELKIKDVNVLFDPTILINFDFWNNFASEKKIKKPYILVYQLHGDTDVYKKAIQFGKENNIKVVRIITMYHQMRPECKNIIVPKIQDFMALLKNAEYVFTDSFHGTIFSLIFRKKLGIILPHKFSGRITSLLSLIDAEQCIIEEMDNWKKVVNEIYIEQAHKKLLEKRTNNINMLEKKIAMLENE